MNDILSEIVAHKRTELERQKQVIAMSQLQEQVGLMQGQEEANAVRRSMKRSLATSNTGIIAEFKRRSPSKGWIYEAADPREVIPAYEAAGASALSVLTNEKFFGGNLRDLREARSLAHIPILRKDFIIDEYQLLQARIVGADAVLLIAACLTQEQCASLTTKAHELGLEVLLEIHTPEELAYVNREVDMVGVNNRNLGTFVTDVENSFRIAEALRKQVETLASEERPVLVSESGISQADTLRRLRAAGFRGFLMGEAFMKTGCPGKTLKELIDRLEREN